MISFLLARDDICWHLHFVETTIFHLSVKYEDEWFYCIIQECWIGINLWNVWNLCLCFLDELHFWLYISCVLNSSCSLGKCRYSRQGFKGIINATKSGTADCHIGIFLVIHKHCVCAHWKTNLKYVLEILKQRNWDSWCMWDECWINVGEVPSSSVVSQTSNTNLLP